MKYISLAVISVVAASMFTTSCIKEEKFSNGASTGKVLIDVNTDNAVLTKAGHKTNLFETVELENEGVSLFLSGTASLYDENPFVGRMATKGTIITTNDETDGKAAINAEGQKFYVTVLDKDGIYHTINNETAKSIEANYDPDGVETKWPLLKEVDWQDVNPLLHFWAYYDMGGNATPSGDGYSRYLYEGPASGKAGMDASLMSDFLVANTNNATQNNVSIHFYHALSAIRFNVDEAFTTDYKSIKVIISGIYNEGDVKYTGNESQMYFDWDWTSSMNADASYEQVLYDTDKAGADGFDAKGFATLVNSTFFIVPQKVGPSTDALFTFEITDKTGHVTVLSANNVGTTSWMPGYIYKYNVGQDQYGNVGVKVNEGADGDTFNHLKKENVRFELTKSSASYLRVAVIANWCLSNGKVYQAYDGGFDVTTDWVSGSDGFYYSVYPVLGHSESDDFIKEFTPRGTVPPAPYPLNLEMKFLVQAISFDVKADGESRAAWAWGPVFADLLEKGKVKTELK